jgi:hypothetical protein
VESAFVVPGFKESDDWAVRPKPRVRCACPYISSWLLEYFMSSRPLGEREPFGFFLIFFSCKSGNTVFSF